MSKLILLKANHISKKDFENNMEYLESEEFEFDVNRKELLGKILKNSIEIEKIENIAKDLNIKIEVKISFII